LTLAASTHAACRGPRRDE